MKKHLIILSIIFVVIFTACGTAPGSAPVQQSDASGAFDPSFQTDSITVYDITMGGSWVIKDEKLIAELAASAQIDNWIAQTALEDQISAVPNYALDFGNGTCIGLLGDGSILLGSAFEYLSEDHQSYRIVDGCQYQVPVDFTNLLKEFMRISPLDGEVPAEAEEISAEPEEISIPAPEASEDTSLESLMTEFMNGSLNGIQFDDGSEAAKYYELWYNMLGGECVPSEASSPQEYWEIWSEHVERLYAANSYEFLVEQDYPISAKYIELKYGCNG